MGRWKIARADPKAPFELFDLFTDPGETSDLSDEHPEVFQRLTAGFEKWRAQFTSSGQ